MLGVVRRSGPRRTMGRWVKMGGMSVHVRYQGADTVQVEWVEPPLRGRLAWVRTDELEELPEDEQLDLL